MLLMLDDADVVAYAAIADVLPLRQRHACLMLIFSSPRRLFELLSPSAIDSADV